MRPLPYGGDEPVAQSVGLAVGLADGREIVTSLGTGVLVVQVATAVNHGRGGGDAVTQVLVIEGKLSCAYWAHGAIAFIIIGLFAYI